LFALQIHNLKLFDLDPPGFKLDLLFLAGQLVSRDASDLLGRKWWRNLLNLSYERARGLLNLLQGHIDWLFWPLGFAFGVISVGGQSELDGPLVPFIGIGVKLGQTGKTSQNQRQDSSSGGIERPQVAHRTLAGDATHASDHIMGGHSRRFIDYYHSIHLSNSELSSMIAKSD
jgi:hypothetical protein